MNCHENDTNINPNTQSPNVKQSNRIKQQGSCRSMIYQVEASPPGSPHNVCTGPLTKTTKKCQEDDDDALLEKSGQHEVVHATVLTFAEKWAKFILLRIQNCPEFVRVLAACSRHAATYPKTYIASIIAREHRIVGELSTVAEAHCVELYCAKVSGSPLHYLDV
jgi:hypothetical protein